VRRPSGPAGGVAPTGWLGRSKGARVTRPVTTTRRPCGCGTKDLARIITSEPEPEFAAELRERYPQEQRDAE
jgi:hypothetical protein